MPLSHLLKESPRELQAESQLILNAVVEGLCGVDTQGNITFCNEALMRISGYRTEELIGNSLHALLHHSRRDGTRYPEAECAIRKAIVARQEIHVVGECLWRKDGTCFPAEYWAHPLSEPSGRTDCVITVQDITERERAMEALRSSEERFRQISNNIDQAFYLIDVIGSRLVYASPAFETITGYSCQEVCEKPSPWRDLAIPEHREIVRVGYERLLAGEEAHDEYRIRHSDGSIRWIKDHAKPILDADGRVCMFAGVVEDISEVHDARDILHQSEEKFRRILASVPDVAWTSDRDRGTTYISPKVETVLGYTKQEICAAGASFRSGLIHPEDFGRVNRSYRALFENQSSFDEEYRIRRKDGTWIWIHDRATGTHEENGIPFADGVLSDITARKQAEAELQWKTAFLEAQANSTIDGILVVGGSGQKLMVNQRLVELFNIPPDILEDSDDRRTLEYVVTLVNDPESFLAKVRRLYRHPREICRDEIELRDGRTIDRYSAPVVDREGKYYGRIWTFRDITERKRNEDMLQQLSMAVEQSPVTVVITDPNGCISYVNPRFTEVTGYTQEEVLGRNPRFLKSGLTPPEVYRNLWSTIKQGREWRGEFCNKKKNGEIYWESAAIRPITDAKGTITHYLGIKEDVTKRRHAERELRLTQFSLEHASDAIIWSDSQSNFVYANAAACRSLGYSREELLSLSVPDLNPHFREKDWASFWEQLKTRGSITFESQNTTKQGRIFPVEITVNWLEFDGQEYSFAFVRDITERKRAEEEVRESNELVKLVLDSVPEAVYGIDVDGNCTFCNPSCLRLLGYQDPSDLHGKNMHTLIHHSRLDGTPYPVEECHIYEAFRRGHGTHIDDEVLWHRDGTSFSAEYWSQPIHRGEKVIGTVVTFVNITERKRGEMERRLTQFSMEHASDAIEWIDSRARIVYANEATCRSLGFSREELLSLSIPDIDPLFPIEVWSAFWEKTQNPRVDNL